MKHYKVLTIIAAMLIGMTAAAQQVNLNYEPQGKEVIKHNRQSFVGSDGQSVVFLQRAGLIGASEDLASYDMQQREQARVKFDNVKIDNSPVIDIEEAIVNGHHLDLICSTEKDNVMTVYLERSDIVTLQPEGERRQLAKLEGASGDKMYCFTAQSPNGKLVAVVTVLLTKGLDATVHATLYSREMEEYWHAELPQQGFSQILVTNDGDIVMAGITQKEQKAVVHLMVADGENVEKNSFVYPASGTIMEHSLTRYAQGKALIVAAVRAETKTFMRVGANIDCIDAITCDINEGTLARDRHTFTPEELCIMENGKGTTSSYHWMNFGNLQQVIADDEGAYAIVDHQWDTYKNQSWTSRERCGMMVLRIGDDGRFKWVRTWRNYAFVGAYWAKWINYRWVPTKEGIMLAWPVNKKDTGLATGKTVKGTKNFGTDAYLNIITMDRNGKAKERNFDIGKQILLDKPWAMGDGRWLLYVSGKSKGAFGHLQITND